MKAERHDAVTTFDLLELTHKDVQAILDHLHRGSRCPPDDVCAQAEQLAIDLEAALHAVGWTEAAP